MSYFWMKCKNQSIFSFFTTGNDAIDMGSFVTLVIFLSHYLMYFWQFDYVIRPFFHPQQISFASSNFGDSSRKLCLVWGKDRLRSYEYQNQQFYRKSHMIFPYSKYSSGFNKQVVGKLNGQYSAMKVESSLILRQMAQVVINFVFLLENCIKTSI